ncbi:hypothetical protein F4861DRAFT_69950 [Xylaria intraflava]|nr:hypothetical protein F4861DRAFT_69950 [Xylaria intraflava]
MRDLRPSVRDYQPLPCAFLRGMRRRRGGSGESVTCSYFLSVCALWTFEGLLSLMYRDLLRLVHSYRILFDKLVSIFASSFNGVGFWAIHTRARQEHRSRHPSSKDFVIGDWILSISCNNRAL